MLLCYVFFIFAIKPVIKSCIFSVQLMVLTVNVIFETVGLVAFLVSLSIVTQETVPGNRPVAIKIKHFYNIMRYKVTF